jgi:hypothetical protein
VEFDQIRAPESVRTSSHDAVADVSFGAGAAGSPP